MPDNKFKSYKVIVSLNFLSIEGSWEINEIQKMAAWEMHVELVKRVTSTQLQKEESLLREVLSSMYSLFNTTRNILKKYEPSIVTSLNSNGITFGHLAIAVLNKVLRPTLSKWHPILLDWENQRPINKNVTEHEAEWKHKEELRVELNQVISKLTEYSNVLAEVSGVTN